MGVRKGGDPGQARDLAQGGLQSGGACGWCGMVEGLRRLCVSGIKREGERDAGVAGAFFGR